MNKISPSKITALHKNRRKDSSPPELLWSVHVAFRAWDTIIARRALNHAIVLLFQVSKEKRPERVWNVGELVPNLRQN